MNPGPLGYRAETLPTEPSNAFKKIKYCELQFIFNILKHFFLTYLLRLYNFKDTCTSFWLDNGVVAEKINLGIPFYCRSFTLEDSKKTNVGSPAKSA